MGVAARGLRAALLLLAAAAPARAEEPRDAWAWLATGAFEDAEAKPAPGTTPEEAATGLAALRSVVTFATTSGDEPPPATAAEASGVLLSADGLVAGPWSLLSRARGPGRTLWARPFDGPFSRAFVLGGSWTSEVGVARMATRRRDLAPMPVAPMPRDAAGKRFVAVGSSLGRRNVIAAASLVSAEWFDPAASGGRAERRVAAGKALGKGAFPLALRFAADPVGAGGEGSAIVGESGACVAIVARVREGASPACVVRPLDLARGLLASVAAEARYDPPDLGVRFEPAPARDGVPALPRDLERMRAATREKGGAVVGAVSPRSPALGALWPGDLVLEIEGLPVFGDVPESVVLALEALPLDLPVEVVTWRGGRRESVTVRAVPGRSVHPDFQAEHDARGGDRSPR